VVEAALDSEREEGRLKDREIHHSRAAIKSAGLAIGNHVELLADTLKDLDDEKALNSQLKKDMLRILDDDQYRNELLWMMSQLP